MDSVDRDPVHGEGFDGAGIADDIDGFCIDGEGVADDVAGIVVDVDGSIRRLNAMPLAPSALIFPALALTVTSELSDWIAISVRAIFQNVAGVVVNNDSVGCVDGDGGGECRLR